MFNDMLMNSRAILGVTLAAVFAVSMIMVPVFAGGHIVVESSEMKKFVKKRRNRPCNQSCSQNSKR